MLWRWIGADAPALRGDRVPWEAYGWAFGIVVAVTAVNHLLHGRLGEANLIMAYLLGLVPVALRGDRGAAMMAAVLAVGAFDWFFVLPYYTFAVSDTQYVFTFLVMGLVGLVLATLTARLSAEISEARHREQREQLARTQAETERMRNALLSSVSHDLRTPLAGIVGAASSLVDGAEALDADTRRELAGGIVEEAERLNRLVTNLLHATRLDAGVIPMARSWASLEEVIGPALGRFSRVLARHTVVVTLPPELPLVYVDPVMVEQVFANLLENAAKYAPEGTAIAIAARQDGPQILVEVLDEGPGLPPGEEERLFEKFRRHARGGAPGAGLGLAIARGVVEAHGGRISAAQRPGGGAVFQFSLPLTPRAVDALAK